MVAVYNTQGMLTYMTHPGELDQLDNRDVKYTSKERLLADLAHFSELIDEGLLSPLLIRNEFNAIMQTYDESLRREELEAMSQIAMAEQN